MRDSLYERRFKRALDITAASAGLLVLSPVFAAVAAAVRLSDGGPVFFRQQRVGLGFRPFTILKFRTMVPNGAGLQLTAGGDSRVTPLGRFLRRTKLDELPQLLNVLRGDMSIVGPRPEVQKYVELFEQDYQVVLSVRPGITDYAAVKYRDEEAALDAFQDPEEGYVTRILPDKITLYRRYVDDVTFKTDMGIILATAWRVAAGR